MPETARPSHDSDWSVVKSRVPHLCAFCAKGGIRRRVRHGIFAQSDKEKKGPAARSLRNSKKHELERELHRQTHAARRLEDERLAILAVADDRNARVRYPRGPYCSRARLSVIRMLKGRVGELPAWIQEALIERRIQLGVEPSRRLPVKQVDHVRFKRQHLRFVVLVDLEFLLEAGVRLDVPGGASCNCKDWSLVGTSTPLLSGSTRFSTLQISRDPPGTPGSRPRTEVARRRSPHPCRYSEEYRCTELEPANVGRGPFPLPRNAVVRVSLERVRTVCPQRPARRSSIGVVLKERLVESAAVVGSVAAAASVCQIGAVRPE